MYSMIGCLLRADYELEGTQFQDLIIDCLNVSPFKQLGNYEQDFATLVRNLHLSNFPVSY
jgi:hypothetical protein